MVYRSGEVPICPGLYAIGGGQFGTLGAYNPTETIIGLACFSANHILEAAGAGRRRSGCRTHRFLGAVGLRQVVTPVAARRRERR
jgi:hypothetical protein